MGLGPGGVEVLLQTFHFYGDFPEALGAGSVGYARKAEPWRRRGGKKREKEKHFLLIMSKPIDAVLLLSDLHIPCSQRPGNRAQLMLANHEGFILNYW